MKATFIYPDGSYTVCIHPEVVSFVLWTSVTHPLFISSHAFHVSYRALNGDQVHRTSTDKYMTTNARMPDKTHVEHTRNVQPADVFARWYLFMIRYKFCACTKFSAEWNEHHQT